MPTTTIQKGQTLLVEGPASLSLQTGEATILGAPLSKELVVVRQDRQVPVEASREGTVDVRLGHGSKYKLVPESTIPTGWSEASTVVDQVRGVIAIVGDVDSGKSTLCTLLVNDCYRRGLSVGVVDGDVGQADIGPPTTISFARIVKHVFSLQELRSEVSLFIGDTSPLMVEEKLTRALVRLKELGRRQVDVTLVNTDGWVQGDGALSYKHQLLSSLHPDLILGISSNGELDPLLEIQGSTSLKLARSPFAKSRSREERKKAREFGYKRFFQNAKRLELKMGQVKLRRYASNQRQLRLDTDEDLRGVIAGLLDNEERLLSIGRMEKAGHGLITVKTAVENTPAIVELGAVVLSPRYEEGGFDS